MSSFINFLNLTSLTAAIISVAMMIFLDWLRPKLLKRVSLQLQTGIAILDITRHLQLNYVVEADNDSLCIFIALFGFFSDQLYMFLNVGIALNLHLLLLHQIQPRWFLKWIYWVTSIAISLFINLVPLSLGYFGKSSWGVCYLTDHIPNEALVKLFLVHLVLWPGIIYCLIISISVLCRSYFISPHNNDSFIYSQPKVIQLGWTIAFYPLTCFLTLISYLCFNLAADGFDYDNPILFKISMLGLASTGLLNLICLLVDRQVWSTIKSFWNSEKEMKDSDIFELSDQLSVDKETPVRPSCANKFASLNRIQEDYYEQEPLVVFL